MKVSTEISITPWIQLFATSIFGNKQKTDTWLLKPRKAFGGQNALQASATTPGYNCVVTLLERLRHGFAA